MKKKSLIFLLIFLSTSVFAQLKYIPKSFEFKSHPRILLFEGEEDIIKKNIEESQEWARIHNAIITESKQIIPLLSLERELTGRRILGISREALRRIVFLSYSYRMTKEDAYKARAEQELLAVSSFSDWNPSHFLDVAEMALAVAIGYDWLYNDLPPTSREIIKKAIIEKALDPSFNIEANFWLRSTNNWNQVCNTGIAYGALAVLEDVPSISKTLIDRSLDCVKLPMGEYAPDGAYPEGFMYWTYGTSYNVLLISAIEKLFETDFGLSSAPGFLASAQFMEHMISPRKESFNYGDCNNDVSLDPTIFWFADKTNDLSTLWSQRYFIKNADHEYLAQERMLPFTMIWGKDIDLKKVTHPTTNIWVGRGTTPVALMRTSWTDPNAIFVACKGGKANSGHAHMDAGSFIMEANGVRWAIDLGMQNYHDLESAGIDLWNNSQNSQRWDVYRYNNKTHNTLTFNGKKQKVDEYASITDYQQNTNSLSATMDLTNVYDDVKSAFRTVSIVDNNQTVVKDIIETTNDGVNLRWSMLTKAKVKKIKNNTFELNQDGKLLTIRFNSTCSFKLVNQPAKSVNSYDEENVGVTIIGFDAVIPSNSKTVFEATLTPLGN